MAADQPATPAALESPAPAASKPAKGRALSSLAWRQELVKLAIVAAVGLLAGCGNDEDGGAAGGSGHSGHTSSQESSESDDASTGGRHRVTGQGRHAADSGDADSHAVGSGDATGTAPTGTATAAAA